jgi:molybdopterin converting factor small subunit
MKIRLVVTGRAYHQAASLPSELELHDGATLQDAIDAVGNLAGSDAQLSPSCLIAISNRHCGNIGRHENCALNDGDELALIAPVAGG